MKNGSNIKRYSADELREMAAQGQSRTGLDRVRAMSEAELEQATVEGAEWHGVAEDWHLRAEAITPRPKVPISIRLDADLVEFFRDQGRGWQTKINAVLRAYVEAVQKSGR